MAVDHNGDDTNAGGVASLTTSETTASHNNTKQQRQPIWLQSKKGGCCIVTLYFVVVSLSLGCSGGWIRVYPMTEFLGKFFGWTAATRVATTGDNPAVSGLGVPGTSSTTTTAPPSPRPSVSVAPSTAVTWALLAPDVNGAAPYEYLGRSVALNGEGSLLVVGGKGRCRIYAFDGDTRDWTLRSDQSQNVLSDTVAVSLSGNGRFVIVGDVYNDVEWAFGGSVFLLRYSNTVWREVAEGPLYGDAEKDGFGTAVAVADSGRLIAVGTEEGRYVKVFERSDNAPWRLVQRLSRFDDSRFGVALALTAAGDLLVVGAPRHQQGTDDDTGAVFVYGVRERSHDLPPTVYVHQTIVGARPGDFFGSTLAVSGDGSRLAVATQRAVGATTAGTTDHVRLFGRDGPGRFLPLGPRVVATDARGFGRALALSHDGGRLAVGAPFAGTAGGTAVYAVGQDAWRPLGSLLPGEHDGDHAGGAVAVSGNGRLVASGALFNAGGGEGSGHVRVYRSSR